jgi:Protein of unknown function (DUF4245)
VVSTTEAGRPRQRKPFLQQSYADMLRSVVVLALIVAVAWGCSQFLESDPETPVRRVDYTSELRDARSRAEYEVLAPQGLPAGWRATSADVTTSGQSLDWHLGFVSPDDAYVGLEQSDDQLPTGVRRVYEDREPDNTLQISGRRWDVYAPNGADTVLVNVDGDVSTAVVSTGGVELAGVFAGALR